MPHALVREPAAPDRDQPTDRPAVRVSPRCPSCGRTSAVVFPTLRPGQNARDAPLVCLQCCPKMPGDG